MRAACMAFAARNTAEHVAGEREAEKNIKSFLRSEGIHAPNMHGTMKNRIARVDNLSF